MSNRRVCWCSDAARRSTPGRGFIFGGLGEWWGLLLFFRAIHQTLMHIPAAGKLLFNSHEMSKFGKRSTSSTSSHGIISGSWESTRAVNVAGDKIEYRLKIVGCLGCPTDFGHFK